MCVSLFSYDKYYCKLFSLSALSTIVVNINNINNSSPITAIDTSNIDGLGGPQISLTIPLELLLKIFSNEDDRRIRIVSAVYRNVSEALSYEK